MPRLAAVVVVGCRLGVAAVYLAAGAGKLRHPDEARRALAAVGLPRALLRSGARALPLVEGGVAVWLLAFFSPAAAAAALVLTAALTSGLGVLALRGGRAPCRCFGRASTGGLRLRPALRNAGLAAACVALCALA